MTPQGGNKAGLRESSVSISDNKKNSIICSVYIITVPADWFSEVTAEDIYYDLSTISRQRLGRNVPEVTLSTIEGYPLLGIGMINTRL
jgi:hypothetical protein